MSVTPSRCPRSGVDVPLVGVNGNDQHLRVGAVRTNLAAQHRSPSASRRPVPGSYHWQCFVPCGLGYLFGNGGGMSTQNYMGGFLDVVS